MGNDSSQRLVKKPWYKIWWVWLIATVFLAEIFRGSPPDGNDSSLTKASQSSYNKNVFSATTSYGLTKADLAWHALNTYGWSCSEVVSVGSNQGSYYVITCSNGTKLRVYPRSDAHPKITNINGTYTGS